MQPASLSLAGNTLVYAHSGGTAISSFDPNGSEATLLASNLSSVQAVTGDASSYYAAADDAILTGSLSAPETPRVLASGLPSPLAVAVAGEDVYFTCVGDGSVRRVPKRGGDVDVIATGLSTPTSIVADGTHLYVASTGDGTVVRVPRR